MDTHYPHTFVDVTADEVLAILRDEHRQLCEFDFEADPSISLSHDSTIADWRNACDLVSWKPLAKAMNSIWSVDIPTADWREVLEPPRTKRLRGVCELLARHAKLPRVRPAAIFGSSCASAGAFLTIRSYLADAGADVREIAPSTSLHEYTRRYSSVFVDRVPRLAPGALPPVRIRAPFRDNLALVAAIAGIVMMAGHCVGEPFTTLAAGFVFCGCYFLTWTVGRAILPASVEFEGLRTFRDLAKAIAGDTR